jgi:hypothetical protein
MRAVNSTQKPESMSIDPFISSCSVIAYSVIDITEMRTSSCVSVYMRLAPGWLTGLVLFLKMHNRGLNVKFDTIAGFVHLFTRRTV